MTGDSRDNRGGLFGRLVAVRPGEWQALLLSGAFFFLILFGYFLIRSIREAMGVQRGMDDLPWLFAGTCVVSLGVTLAFGGVVSRMNRRRFIAVAYRAVIACLLAFALVWSLGLSSDARVWTGYAFYIWLSVVNVFMMSVFWAFMADVWALEQGKRLYAAIGVGGTLGAIAGSAFAWRMAAAIGPVWQMILAAALFEGAVWVMYVIDRRSARARAVAGEAADRRVLGGSWAEGAAAVARSPYLLGVGGYLALMAVSSTLIYFTQAHLVSDAEDELVERVSLFAQLDMWAQVATLLVQVFVTSRLIRLAGVGVTLSVLPIVTVVGFAALAFAGSRPGVEAWQVFAVFAVFNALHRATRYALARPARETLFSVVPETEKYKAKPIVDVFVYRGGDVAGAGITALIVSVAGMALAAAPVGVLWVVLSMWLARGQRVRAGVQAAGDETEPGVAPEGAMR